MSFVLFPPEMELWFKKLDDRAVTPSYAHDGDVGMDITAIDVEYDKENDMYIYHTGLTFESPKGFGAFLFPRSSNRKTDAYLCNHVGIADTATYRGEILFCYKNRTSLKDKAKIEMLYNFFIEGGGETEGYVGNVAWDAYHKIIDNPMDYAPYKVGERIGQMVILPHPYTRLIEKDELSDTERGENGFGSTGN